MINRQIAKKCDIMGVSAGCGAVGSARLLGSRGRWFKSSHPDHFLCYNLSDGAWRSLVARTHGVREVRSSNLLAPTK